MTPEEIKADEKIIAEATPGPWEYTPGDPNQEALPSMKMAGDYKANFTVLVEFPYLNGLGSSDPDG